MAGGVMDRCPTGIVGFDRMSQGGFIRNSDNLLVGGPGSGKSTFLLQFLWNGATMFNENGLYCSFEPDIVETLSDAMAYGWDFTRLSNEGRMKFMRFSPYTSVDELKGELTAMIAKNNIRRICFDPISVLALNLSEQGKIREIIFELSSLMKRLKVTSVLADESLEGDGINPSNDGEWTKTDILRFLSDSVTIMYESGISARSDRSVRIAKMRRTNHERKTQGMAITDKGILVDYNLPRGVHPALATPHPSSEETSKAEVIEPAKQVPVVDATNNNTIIPKPQAVNVAPITPPNSQVPQLSEVPKAPEAPRPASVELQTPKPAPVELQTPKPIEAQPNQVAQESSPPQQKVQQSPRVVYRPRPPVQPQQQQQQQQQKQN